MGFANEPELVIWHIAPNKNYPWSYDMELQLSNVY